VAQDRVYCAVVNSKICFISKNGKEFVWLSDSLLLNAGFHILLDRVVYISDVRCAAVYGLHFLSALICCDRHKHFWRFFQSLTRRLVSYNNPAERRGHHLVSWFQSVWRVIVHDRLLVKTVTHRYVNIGAKLRKRTTLLGHLAFGLLPAWCCNPMARLSAGRKWQSCFWEWFTTRGSRSVCAVFRTITRHCT